ncbi:hypothetical protein PIB30_011579 [Stylosanthes scabra]|uniref:Uncharacterized protein n=1 Tax=Stylosanthes scabra TaxID=79078 RepID=A0ABU6U4P1_9FABA|nr:hypothetical protein [Stylosanthes scabra]
MGRSSPCCSKAQDLKRGAWTADEDKILRDYIRLHGHGRWRNLPQKAGLKRCGKSCRLRWLNYLRPDIKRGNISSDEEELIIRLHNLLGNRWSLIAGRLPGRTDNEIKNYWNTNLSKRINNHNQRQTTNTSSSSLQPTLPQTEPTPFKIDFPVIRTKATKCSKPLLINNNDPPLLLHNNPTNNAAQSTQLLDSATANNHNNNSVLSSMVTNQNMQPATTSNGFVSFFNEDDDKELLSKTDLLIDDYCNLDDAAGGFHDLLINSDVMGDELLLLSPYSDQPTTVFSDDILNQWTHSYFTATDDDDHHVNDDDNNVSIINHHFQQSND